MVIFQVIYPFFYRLFHRIVSVSAKLTIESLKADRSRVPTDLFLVLVETFYTTTPPSAFHRGPTWLLDRAAGSQAPSQHTKGKHMVTVFFAGGRFRVAKYFPDVFTWIYVP